MDLIGQLINQKEKDNNANIQLYLEELIKYEKLSRSPKFKHIKESTILQKQLPLCWEAFNGDSYSIWMLYNCKFIINALNVNLPIFDDLFNGHYKSKEFKQKLIIGNAFNIKFKFFDLLKLALDFKNDDYNDSNYIQLRQKNSEQDGYNYIVIKQDDNNIYIYQGFIENSDEKLKNYFAYKEYVKKSKDLDIKIKAFSPQGNNNYNFAVIKDNESKLINVSMPNDSTFLFRDANNVKLAKINLTKSDENVLNLNINDINVIADMITKYYILTKQRGENNGTK